MKKLLIVIGSIIIIILAALFIIPIAFKDDIKAAIDKALAESVDADMVWDTDDFSISLFKNFPNATATLNNFGIVNRAPFEGQILFAVEHFEVEVDIFSLLGDQIKIKGIELDHPEVFIKVLEDGTANYDIAIASDSIQNDPASDTATVAYNIGIDHWQITNGHVIYDDASMPFKMELTNLQHSGSGDFTQDIFDVSTKTTADSVTVVFDGIEYITDKHVDIDAILTISDEYTKYTFKENAMAINDFTLNFEGYLAMLEDGSMDMDINYGTRENTFKSLLSLVPGVYNEDFKDIQTEGTLSFEGTVKGKYDSLTLPAFGLSMKVDNALFKYPDLPTAIENINMDLLVDNNDGIIENTMVNLKQFHMDFGQNPVDAKILLKNLRDYDMDATVKGKLNLGELNTMFPMEGLSMKGIFNIDLTASGVYDSVKQLMPSIDATMAMSDGYVKTSEFPYALENLSFDAKITDQAGTMSDFKAVVNNFKMIMDGEPFGANLTLQNLDNYQWNLAAKGTIDLDKITKVFPLEGMSLAGLIKADINTAGVMSDLEAERYEKLPTSGTVSVSKFKYTDNELPYDVTIETAQASFNPRQMTLSSYKGTIGKSDMSLDGTISNYIGYMFGENQVLKGTMNLRSNMLDLNEFMAEEDPAAAPTVGEEEAMGVIQVPEDIDFILKSDIEKALIMDMEVKNATGIIIVKNGIANLTGLNFNLLEGAFVINGSYNARDIKKPEYNFNMDIKNLSIQKAFTTFEMVRKFAPIAEKVNGNLSTNFRVNGLLNDEMMPNLVTTSGAGLLEIAKATVNNSKIVNSIMGIANLGKVDEFNLRDVLMSVKIEDGKLKVEPFDVTIGGYKTTIGGATALDGSIDYNLKMDVPAGKLGTQFNNLIATYGGGSNSGSVIPLNIGLGGSYDSPRPKLLMGDQKEQAKDAVKEKAKEEAKDAAKDILKDVKDDKAKEVIGNILGNDNNQDSTKSDNPDVKKDIEEEAKDKIKDLFKKKRKN